MSRLILCILIILLAPLGLYAHGVDSVESTAEARIAKFTYASGEPIEYCAVSVLAPDGDEVISGFSDVNGLFAFVPYTLGDWVVECSDGMGHKGTITLAVGNIPNEDATIGNTKAPIWLNSILGISIICNIFFVYYLVKKRK